MVHLIVGVGSPTELQGSRTSFIQGVVTVPPNERILAGAVGGRKIRSRRSRMEREKNDEKNGKVALDLVFTEHLCENDNKASTSTDQLMLPFLKHFSNQQTSVAELPKCVESIQKCDG